ncbi:adenylyltransferase/cytidyltransferase family protein [Patescibacteria group bacterium]
MTKKNVLVFGTFDLLHQGHINFINQAKRHGRVTVVIARDKTVKKLKGFWPNDKERTRLSRMAKLPVVQKAILGDHNLNHKYLVIKKLKPDLICLGYDQKYFIKGLVPAIKKYNLKVKIIRLKSYQPRKYKSSIYRIS